jgi:hypothetical protein
MKSKTVSLNITSLFFMLSLFSPTYATDLPCAEATNSLKDLAASMALIQTEFQDDKVNKLQDEDESLYALSPKDLAAGKIQIHTQILDKSKFLKKYAHVEKMDEAFHGYLAKKNYGYVFHTRYAYVIPSVSVDQFQASLYKNETYTKLVHPKDTFNFPAEDAKDLDFTWIVEQKIPVLSDIKSKVNYEFIQGKDVEKNLSAEQQNQVKLNTGADGSASLVTIQHVAKSHTPKKGALNLGPEHSQIKSSFIVTSYYPAGKDGKDLLLVVSQYSTLEKPFYIPESAITGGKKDFNSDIATLVKNKREFFSHQ